MRHKKKRHKHKWRKVGITHDGDTKKKCIECPATKIVVGKKGLNNLNKAVFGYNEDAKNERFRKRG